MSHQAGVLNHVPVDAVPEVVFTDQDKKSAPKSPKGRNTGPVGFPCMVQSLLRVLSFGCGVGD